MVISPLLIRGFGVRVPGGAPVLTRAFFHSEDRPVCFPGLLTATPTATGSAILARQLVMDLGVRLIHGGLVLRLTERAPVG